MRKKIPEIFPGLGQGEQLAQAHCSSNSQAGRFAENNFFRASWGPPTLGIRRKKGDNFEQNDRYISLRLYAVIGIQKKKGGNPDGIHTTFLNGTVGHCQRGARASGTVVGLHGATE